MNDASRGTDLTLMSSLSPFHAQADLSRILNTQQWRPPPRPPRRTTPRTTRLGFAWRGRWHTPNARATVKELYLLQEGAYDWADAVAARDRKYITAVAHYNDGDFLAARAAAEEALKHDAMCRQASSHLPSPTEERTSGPTWSDDDSVFFASS